MNTLSRSIKLLLLAVAVALSAAPASAGPINVGTVRGEVVSSEADCLGLSCLISPHGCYVVISVPDPIVIGIPAGEAGVDCEAIEVDSCFEATGYITDDMVSEGFSIDEIRIAASTWGALPYEYCDP